MAAREVPNAYNDMLNQYQVQLILVICTYIVKVMSVL